MDSSRRRLLGVVVALATVLALAGCGGDDDDSGSAAAGTTVASSGSGSTAPTVEAPDKITIAYQAIPNGDLVVKHEKWLEAEFPDTDIEWKLFDSGGSVNEAVVAGSVDFGLAGSSPVSRGISDGIEYKVPWVHDVIGKAEALVVKDGIADFDGLKGKKIATPFASTSHFSLIAALQDAGVDEKDVDIIDAEPDDIYAAWSRGDIDGAYVWNPNLAKMIDDGGKVLITSEDLSKKGKTTYDLAVVRNEFAAKYPDVVKTWVAQQNKAVELYRSDPDKAAADVAAELNISPDEAAAQMKDLIFLNASEQAGADYLGGGLATNLFDSAKFNEALGKIEQAQDEQAYKDAVDPSYVQSVG
jgi:taurine transport system substrate-binding protein